LIVPGLYLIYAFSFAFPVYVEFRSLGLSMMDSLTVSNKQVWKKFVNFIVFNAALSGIVIVGIFALGVGVLVTFPLAILAHTIAVRDIFGLRDTHEYEMGVSGKI